MQAPPSVDRRGLQPVVASAQGLEVFGAIAAAAALGQDVVDVRGWARAISVRGPPPLARGVAQQLMRPWPLPGRHVPAMRRAPAATGEAATRTGCHAQAARAGMADRRVRPRRRGALHVGPGSPGGRTSVSAPFVHPRRHGAAQRASARVTRSAKASAASAVPTSHAKAVDRSAGESGWPGRSRARRPPHAECCPPPRAS